MYLFTATSALLFVFFQLNPMFRGPVGVAFEVSMSLLGAVGLLSWAQDHTQANANSFMSTPGVRHQLAQFFGLPRMIKLALLLIAITLPLWVSAAIGM